MAHTVQKPSSRVTSAQELLDVTRAMVAEAERKQAAFNQAALAADQAALAAAAAAAKAAAAGTHASSTSAAESGAQRSSEAGGASSAAGAGTAGAGARSGAAPAPLDPRQQEELTDFLNKFRIVVVRLRCAPLNP